MSLFLPIVEIVGEGAGVNLKHFFKLGVTITAMFLGFQFGRDIANKVQTMGSNTTPA